MSSNSSIQNLVKQFHKLPSVGQKTAQRFVYALIKDPSSGQLQQLEAALKQVYETIGICKKCFNIAEKETCEFCDNTSRDKQIICAVEDALDVISVEECGEFNGVYHILGSGETPHFQELIARIKEDGAKEIIIASSPSAEGEAIALELHKIILENFGSKIKITRLGRGLPTGGDIKYADSETMRGALRGRQEII